MGNKLRLIVDQPRSATLNMAIDEILMESQMSSESLPVLRIYFWDKPSISLGYFQDVQEIARRYDAQKKGIAVVRRITGGGMVYHTDDLTFSLSLKNPNPFLPSDTKSSYLKVNEALREGLREIYPALEYADCKSIPSGRASHDRVCFERPACYDLLLKGKKVVGASQRRKEGIMLHQATIFLKAERDRLIQKILSGFERKWSVKFAVLPLSSEELALAAKRELERYTQPEWAFSTSLYSSSPL